ncbi:MAG: esterase/lipase family protein [Myxococcota bacterium]
MRVFLIHGMGRSRASLFWLATRLRRAGHTPSLFGYRVSTQSLEHIAEAWRKHIHRVRAHDVSDDETRGGYAVVGHSLGNIITRCASDRLPEGFHRFVMLAPPNQPPRLAGLLRNRLLYRGLAADAGQRLADPDFYAQLPIPKVPTLVIAGDAGRLSPILPYGTGDGSDGVVGIDETRLPTPHVHRVVPAMHTFIMNSPEVARIICEFLVQGDLDPHK